MLSGITHALEQRDKHNLTRFFFSFLDGNWVETGSVSFSEFIENWARRDRYNDSSFFLSNVIAECLSHLKIHNLLVDWSNADSTYQYSEFFQLCVSFASPEIVGSLFSIREKASEHGVRSLFDELVGDFLVGCIEATGRSASVSSIAIQLASIAEYRPYMKTLYFVLLYNDERLSKLILPSFLDEYEDTADGFERQLVRKNIEHFFQLHDFTSYVQDLEDDVAQQFLDVIFQTGLAGQIAFSSPIYDPESKSIDTPSFGLTVNRTSQSRDVHSRVPDEQAVNILRAQIRQTQRNPNRAKSDLSGIFAGTLNGKEAA